MSYDTINTQEVITLFHRLMQKDGDLRVLRLIGGAKMGKSHLLTKVFPHLAQQDYQAHCAILDLRNQTHTVPDYLHSLCGQLGGQSNSHYFAAYQKWLNRPKQVGMQQLLALFSRVTISIKDSSSDLHERDIHFTAQFTKDLSQLEDKALLLLFDSVNHATEDTQAWLTDTLLVHLAALQHVRIVLAGRALPDANSSYTAYCRSYQLSPVTELEAYIKYCRNANLTLPDQSIRDLARVFHYTPGIFVDYVVPAFIPEKVSHD